MASSTPTLGATTVTPCVNKKVLDKEVALLYKGFTFSS